MGCGCVSQHQGQQPTTSPGPFLRTVTESEFRSSLTPEELKDQKRVLAFFRLELEGKFEATEQLRELVRQHGAPPRYRWQVWRALTGWPALCRPGVYDRWLNRDLSQKVSDTIKKDLERTFPKLDEFDEKKQLALANVLKAHANLFPDVAYCQGMNFVVGFFLLVWERCMQFRRSDESNEEAAFFLLVQVMVKYKATLLFCDPLPLVKLLTFEFKELLRTHFSEVHHHFIRYCVTPELFLTRWLLTMFTQAWPFDSAARIWDLIVCDGLQALVLIALAHIKILQPRLLKVADDGITELLRFDSSNPPDGGDIVRAALKLQATIKQSTSTWSATDEVPSKLFEEWERTAPEDAAHFKRAEEEILRIQSNEVDSGLPEPTDAVRDVHAIGCPSPQSLSVQAGSCRDSSGSPAFGAPQGSKDGEGSVPGEIGGVEGPLGIATESKVALDPPMYPQKPAIRTPPYVSHLTTASGTQAGLGASDHLPSRGSKGHSPATGPLRQIASPTQRQKDSGGPGAPQGAEGEATGIRVTGSPPASAPAVSSFSPWLRSELDSGLGGASNQNEAMVPVSSWAGDSRGQSLPEGNQRFAHTAPAALVFQPSHFPEPVAAEHEEGIVNSARCRARFPAGEGVRGVSATSRGSSSDRSHSVGRSPPPGDMAGRQRAQSCSPGGMQPPTGEFRSQGRDKPRPIPLRPGRGRSIASAGGGPRFQDEWQDGEQGHESDCQAGAGSMSSSGSPRKSDGGECPLSPGQAKQAWASPGPSYAVANPEVRPATAPAGVRSGSSAAVGEDNAPMGPRDEPEPDNLQVAQESMPVASQDPEESEEEFICDGPRCEAGGKFRQQASRSRGRNKRQQI